MRFVKAAKASPHAKFYNLSADYRNHINLNHLHRNNISRDGLALLSISAGLTLKGAKCLSPSRFLLRSLGTAQPCRKIKRFIRINLVNK